MDSMEDWTIEYILPRASQATFSVRFQRYLLWIFFNGDDERSRNDTESQCMFAFCILGRKIELIRAANHKGEHISTSWALLNQDLFLILPTRGQKWCIPQRLQKYILLVKIKLTNGTSVQDHDSFWFFIDCIFLASIDLGFDIYIWLCLILEVRNRPAGMLRF